MTDDPLVNAPPEMLTPSEVAAIMHVNAKTVTRWAKDGIVPKTTADLAELRIQIDKLNEELLDALKEYLQTPVDHERLRCDAGKLLSGEGIDDHVRSFAIEPLLK